MKAGRFYFKQTVNRNLIGEFSNDATTRSFTESADLCSESLKDDFVGVYNSTWYEQLDNRVCSSKLEISKKHESIFTLKWTGDDNYEGEGMLCDNILLGNYWSK